MTNALKKSIENKEEYVVLKATTRLSKITDPEIKEILTAMYRPQRSLSGEDKLLSKLTAIWLNSLFTQKRYVYMSTYRDFVKLVANDKNQLKRKTISFAEFRAFSLHLLINKYIRVVRDPSGAVKGSNMAKAGVYEVIFADIINIIGRTNPDASRTNPDASRTNPDASRTNPDELIKNTQMAQCIEIYDETGKFKAKFQTNSSRVSEHLLEHLLVYEYEEKAGSSNNNIKKDFFSKEEEPKKKENQEKEITDFGQSPEDLTVIEKLSYLLASDTFIDLIAIHPKKRLYLDMFLSFQDLVYAKINLSSGRASMINDWYIKVKTKEKHSLIDGRVCVLEDLGPLALSQSEFDSITSVITSQYDKEFLVGMLIAHEMNITPKQAALLGKIRMKAQTLQKLKAKEPAKLNAAEEVDTREYNPIDTSIVEGLPPIVSEIDEDFLKEIAAVGGEE